MENLVQSARSWLTRQISDLDGPYLRGILKRIPPSGINFVYVQFSENRLVHVPTPLGDVSYEFKLEVVE